MKDKIKTNNNGKMAVLKKKKRVKSSHSKKLELFDDFFNDKNSFENICCNKTKNKIIFNMLSLLLNLIQNLHLYFFHLLYVRFLPKYLF
jgi:hypothetical protein